MIWAVLTGQLTGSSFGLRLALYFPSASISSVFVAMYLYLKFFLLNSFLYLLVSWAWWDWPLTWLTNHWPSVVWHCWLGHLTHKIVPKMAYNVSSEMLNPTVPYYIAVFWIYLKPSVSIIHQISFLLITVLHGALVVFTVMCAWQAAHHFFSSYFQTKR